jgi:hypothetical protein
LIPRFQFVFIAFLFALATALVTEHSALAYVDPGSGLLILQNVGAVMTGVVFFFRRRIKAFFTRKSDVHEDGPSEPPPTAP